MLPFFCFFALLGLMGLWGSLIQRYAKWQIRPGWLQIGGGWFQIRREFQPPARLVVTYYGVGERGALLRLWVYVGARRRHLLLHEQEGDEVLSVGRCLSERTGFPLELPWEPV